MRVCEQYPCSHFHSYVNHRPTSISFLRQSPPAYYVLSRLILRRYPQRLQRLCSGIGQRAPRGGVYGQPLPSEKRLELRPFFRPALHRRNALKARRVARCSIRLETFLHHGEILRMIRRKLQLSAFLQTMPKRFKEKRTKQTMRMMLSLGPWIGEEHIHPSCMMLRQKILECVKSLQTKDMRVRKPKAHHLAAETPYTLLHSLYAEKLPARAGRRAPNKETTLPAAYFHLQRTRQVVYRRTLQRLRRILHSNRGAVIYFLFCHPVYVFDLLSALRLCHSPAPFIIA